MKVDLAYGRGYLPVEFPDDRTTVIMPAHHAGLADEKGAIMSALEHPIGSPPLRDLVKTASKVCVVFTDITRATPNQRLIPWLLDHLAGIPRDAITLLNGTGTHRPSTPAEFERMLTPGVVRDYRVVNHECEDAASLAELGVLEDGASVLVNRRLVEADVRIITGFIEPHFFAGFSGGPKGIMPGVAGLRTIMTNHGARNIGHELSTFGVTDGNPIWEQMRDVALRVGPSFVLNVALNQERQIAGVFAGDLLAAHRVGIEFVRQSAMQKVSQPFDIVVTTNSGYPLDLNLYQGVKGMSAGARIVRENGMLILACECSEGVPPNSPYDKLLRSARNPEEILEMLATPGFERSEQWQAHIQALCQRKARVFLRSSLPDEVVKATHLTPCADIGAAVRDKLTELGSSARVAVLPQGPLTIPYLA